MTNVIPIKGAQTVRKADQSRMETLLLTSEIVCPWRVPPFQRPLRVNAKIRAIAEEMKSNGGFVTGVLTLGRIGDGPYYIVDGQHRIEAARLSELEEFIAVKTIFVKRLKDGGVQNPKFPLAAWATT